MRIERFAVRNFRKLTGGVAVDGLPPGLTVIVGDNEEGKSTLLRALQSGFFDRHKLTGKGLEQMLPFATRGVNPKVEITFELAGNSYWLTKEFGGNAAARLEGTGERWEGEAAEDKLGNLLGFSRPLRGVAGEEHRGLAGLLWVEQGRAFQPLAMNRDSQAVFRAAIEGEVGQVLGGERGRRLLERVEERAGRYFTRTGRERDKLSSPRKHVERLTEECNTLERELQAYDNQVNRLGKLQEKLTRYKRKGVLARAKEEAEKSNAAMRRLEVVEGRLNTAKAEMDQAANAKALAEEIRDSRKELINEVEGADRQARKAEDALQELGPDYHDAGRRLTEAEERFVVCNKARDGANQAWEAARRAFERARLATELQELDQRFRKAESLHEEIERTQGEIMKNPVNEDCLLRLRQLRSEQIRLESALKAAAATLVFRPESGQSVSRDGAPVDTRQSVHVTRSSTFHLHHFGTLEVTPGGKDLAGLRHQLAKVRNQLTDLLRNLQLADLANAEVALRAKKDMEARLQNLRGAISGVAPQGLHTLRTTLQKQRARLSTLAGAGEAGNLPDVGTAQAAEQAALGNREQTAQAAERAMGERDKARTLHDGLRERYIKADAERRQKAEIAAQRRAALEEARRKVGDGELAASVEQKVRMLAKCHSHHARVQEECDAMNPDVLRMEQQRAAEAYEELQKAIHADERDAYGLATELRTLGQRGLAEELEQKRGELAIARSDLERVEADAKAWKLLLETLRNAEHEAKETFLGPVRERLQPYLRMLFPETELRLSEDDLEIISLQRGGIEEPFATLSIGAREQVAVLTRLALADLLRERGRPVVLILDDPLVNSDDERFRRMELALRKAASSPLQIVILTCHEARYETMGAKIIRMADCQMETT